MVGELLALPALLGGLGISDLTSRSRDEYDASVVVTQPLVESIIRKWETYDTGLQTALKDVKRKVRMQRKTKLEQEASDVHLKIPQEMKRNMTMVQEKGASSWLMVLPIAEYDFALPKGDFRDALMYPIQLEYTSTTITMCLWIRVLSITCYGLSKGRFP